MNLKNTGLAIAIAALVMSGSALAGGYGGGHGGGGGDSTEHNDFLSHNNTNIGAGDDNNGNGAGNDGNNLTSNVGGGDDNNKSWKNSANTTSGGGDDNNKSWKNSANTTTTTTTTNSLSNHQLSFEVDMVLAKSDLDGHISNVQVEYGEAGSKYHRRGCNECAGAGVNVRNSNSIDGFASSAGITTIGQNAGAASLVQQSVVTNASVHTK